MENDVRKRELDRYKQIEENMCQIEEHLHKMRLEMAEIKKKLEKWGK